MIRLARTVIYPAAMRYQGELARTAVSMAKIGKDVVTDTLDTVTVELRKLQKAIQDLESVVAEVEVENVREEMAKRYCCEVLPIMKKMRQHADTLELFVPDDLWALPNYEEILFDK